MGTAVTKTEPTMKSVASLLNRAMPQIDAVAAKTVTAERLVKVALVAMGKTPKIMQCSKESLVLALMQSAQCGLEPNGRDAALIPYWNPHLYGKGNGGLEARFQEMFRGRAKLITRSKAYRHIDAVAVFDGDTFSYGLGLTPHLVHEPTLKNPGMLTHVYCIIRPTDSSIPVNQHPFVVMSKAEVEHVRAKSKNANSGPWVDDYPEMAKKTVINRISKTLDYDDDDTREAIDKADEVEFTVMDPHVFEEAAEAPKGGMEKVKAQVPPPKKKAPKKKPPPSKKEAPGPTGEEDDPKTKLARKIERLVELRGKARAMELDSMTSDAEGDIESVIKEKDLSGIETWIQHLAGELVKAIDQGNNP